MAPPLISIVVPTRNRAVLLRRLLESMAKLRYPHFEILVVDDGSTDETAGVVAKFQASGVPLRYWYQPWRKMGAARNRALAEARGVYVAFTDDDCVVTPDWLAAIARAFETHEDAFGVQGKTVTDHAAMTPFTRQVEQLEGGQPYRTCNIAYRTDVIRSLGGFDEHLIRGEDVVMGMRVLEIGPIIFASEAVVIHPPRPKEWADRAAWRTLLESELHFKRTYPQYGVARSSTLSVQKAEHVLSRWVLLPVRRYWRRHYRYFRRHPIGYLRYVPLIVREKFMLFSLMPYFYRNWRQVRQSAGPPGPDAARPGQDQIYQSANQLSSVDATPTVSVVVPTRNRQQYLSRLLGALERQDYAPHEIVVVDDASDDGTADLLRAWTGPGRVVLRVDQSRGSYTARNQGWRVASSAVVAFTDDDCVPHPGWLSGLVQALTLPEAVGAQGVTRARPGAVTPFTHQIEQTRPGPPYRTCNIAYRRDILETLDGFDERMRWYADNIFGLRVRLQGPIAFAGAAVVDHPPRPREYRNRQEWLARFAADAEYRRYLQHLQLEPRVPGGVLPVVLWIVRPLLKQSYRHLRCLLSHPHRYRRAIGPMAREKLELLHALVQYWRGMGNRQLKPSVALPTLATEPSVSVGIVTRGRAEELTIPLEAIRNQQRPPQEIIVIEQTGRQTNDVPALGSDVRVLPAPAGGLGAARQLAAQVATGDIIAFTDDDCAPDAAWLAAAVAAFRDQPAWWGVQGRTEPEPGPIGAHTVRIRRANPLYQTCNIAYRRAALERVGGFDTGFQRWFEDTALGARVSAEGPIGWAPDMLVIHRATRRRSFNRSDWRRLLADERRLARCYPDFYRRVRGPNVPVVVIARWLVGSPLKTLLRELPQGRHDVAGYLYLIRSLLRERIQLLAELADWR